MENLVPEKGIDPHTRQEEGILGKTVRRGANTEKEALGAA